MVRSGRRNLTRRWTTVCAVRDENFPSIVRNLQRIQIKCDQIIEEEALDLATEDVYPRPQNVQGMTIAA